jgi:hypothetical protein
VGGAGQSGGSGFADLALGHFGSGSSGIPQVLCEFKQRHDVLDALLQPGATLAVSNTDDELTLHIGNREALRLYDRPDTPFIAAQWRHALRNLNVTEAFNATRLLKLLLTLRTTPEPTLYERILTLDSEITTLDQTIAEREVELNATIYRLYHLTSEEIAMVEGG